MPKEIMCKEMYLEHIRNKYPVMKKNEYRLFRNIVDFIVAQSDKKYLKKTEG